MILVIEEDDEVEIPIAECLLKHAKSELKVHIYVFNFLDINNMNLHSYPDKNIPSNWFGFYFQETSAASFELAEKVIGACSEKLKPVFLQLLKGTSLNEYDNIIATICEDSSDVKEDMDADPSGKDVVSWITNMQQLIFRDVSFLP